MTEKKPLAERHPYLGGGLIMIAIVLMAMAGMLLLNPPDEEECRRKCAPLKPNPSGLHCLCEPKDKP